MIRSPAATTTITSGGPAHAGVYYRERQDLGVNGNEYQLLDNDQHANGRNPLTRAGSLFSVLAPEGDAARPVGEFNTSRIICRGPQVEHWLNGKRVLAYDLDSKEFKAARSRVPAAWRDQVGARSGCIYLQCYSGETTFRNIRIRRLGAAETANAGPDRAAAEWVLSIDDPSVWREVGVEVDGAEVRCSSAEELPGEPFRLVRIRIGNDAKLSKRGLEPLRGCVHLRELLLHDSSVGDEEMKVFEDCMNLETLNLNRTRVGDDGLRRVALGRPLVNLQLDETPVTDAGLAHIEGCDSLSFLTLAGAHVTGKGLVHLRGCQSLQIVHLEGLSITDDSLAAFENCERLRTLALRDTPVTDAGLAHLANCPLSWLRLDNTAITDDGVARLAKHPLASLNLSNTRITDAALEQAGKMPLTALDVTKTDVTRTGVEALAKVLPTCRILWDGGVIEPTAAADPDRAPAE